MHETSGVLRAAIEAWLDSAPLSDAQIGTLRAYLRQWIWHGDWIGAAVEGLRRDVERLNSRAAIADWLDRAAAAGIDPL